MALSMFENYVDGARAHRATQPCGHRRRHAAHVRVRACSTGHAPTRRRIVLPEGEDDRILRAAGTLLTRNVVDLTILGDPAAITTRAGELGIDLSAAQLLSPTDPEYVDRFAADYYEMRKAKGMTPEAARDRVQDVSYFGTMMVQLGLADGMVSGAAHTTAHTIVPSFQIIKTTPGRLGRVVRVPHVSRRPRAGLRRLRGQPRPHRRAARGHRDLVCGDGEAIQHRAANRDAFVLDGRVRHRLRRRQGPRGDSPRAGTPPRPRWSTAPSSTTPPSSRRSRSPRPPTLPWRVGRPC